MAAQGSRREAILEAMIRVVGEKGYASTSVADVLAQAGASRATFYKHFDGKLDCFLAALDVAAERVLDAATDACQGDGSWEERSRRGLAAVVELFADSPNLARATMAEAATAGAAARQRYWATIGRLSRLIEGAGRVPRGAELPPSTSLMAVAAVSGLIFDALKDEQEADLSALLPELEFALLVPYLGPRAAAEACGPPLTSSSR
jgi:AcrR family transcriptional regulator